MPTYYARGISVRLGAVPLADTVTTNIELRKGEAARRKCEEAEKKLLGSALLQETRVRFPGDENGFELHWLGGAPFMQVLAGDGLFDDKFQDDVLFSGGMVNTTQLRRAPTPNSNITHSPNSSNPMALSLHVNLSDNTFISGMDTQNKIHLKIDTFFNGQLSSCLFVPPHDIRSGAKSLHQVFAGYRSDYLVERPWVILSPQKNADGSPRKSKGICLPEDRWNGICEALVRESEARNMDKDGNIPPSAEFLKALATMQMPDQVKGMQRAGSRAFGVVDVVITAGDGRKVTSGAGYLKAPQRLMDENFPETVVSYGAADQAHLTGQDEMNDEEAPNVLVPTTTYLDQGVEGESNYDYKFISKRRALPPYILPTVPTPTTRHSHFPRNSLREALISSTPETVLRKPQGSQNFPDVLPADQLSSFQAQKTPGFLMSSPECGRTYIDHGGLNRITYDTPRSLYGFATSNITLGSTPQMSPSPYVLHYSDPVLAHEQHQSAINQISSASTGAQSSPMLGVTRGSEISPSRFFAPGQLLEEAMVGFRQHHTQPPPQIEVPELPSQSSMMAPRTPQFMSTAPWLRPQYPVLHPPGTPQWPGNHPNILPVSTHFGYHGNTALGGLPYPPPYDRRLSLPLPPTAMFSVPTKPRLSLSLSRKPPIEKPKESQRSFLVKRLIITGKESATIVDHKWITPSHIAMNDGISHVMRSPEHLPPHSLASASCSTPQSVRLPVGRELIESPSQTSNDDLSRHDQEQAPGSESRDDAVSSNAESRDFSRQQEIEVESDLQTDVVASTAPGSPQKAKTDMITTTKHAVPQRHMAVGSNILGVQGPKATTFWLEDPEEIMREAAKQRRAASPSNRSKTSSASKQVSTGLDFRRVRSSSPLSSVPTSPEPKAGLDVAKISTPSFVPPIKEAGDSISQFDGSPERAGVSSSPLKLTPSPTKLLSSSTPRLALKPQSTPQSSASPNTKKRKYQGRYMVKQPRSPDRLKTISNPPLNRNCVIAFAESEDKQSERGVLRQVKGERQGVFAEEYVVYAARFFVAGN
jgi:hypothetical protein